jgi:hypothetical protein
MTMARWRQVTLWCATSAWIVLAATGADAANQGISGKKLLLIDGVKFVMMSTDRGILVSGSPACPAADSSLTFSDGVHTKTFALPCENWKPHGPTSARYRTHVPSAGPSSVLVDGTAAHDLKVVGLGLGGFPVPNGAATITAVLALTGATDRYCMSFTGTGDGRRFLVKNAPAGACPVCGNGVVDPGETCDGSSDAACPGFCQADCTCTPATCGNNVREGAEVCDGTDSAACPNACLKNCTCPGTCPMTPGDATACEAFGASQACMNCCTDKVCLICEAANVEFGCADSSQNDLCAQAVIQVGCAAECCP